jgi:deoxyribose-phosphate aldolase
MIEKIKDTVKALPKTGIGGIVGFPSGGETTSMKVNQAKELVAAGCDEVDMVMNIGKLKSGFYDEVKSDIMAVKEAVAPLPLKVIMEVCLLTDEEIAKASQIICDCGVAYMKTGTGWAGSTTMHHIEVIKSTVGDTIPLKVAGGVRDLKTLLEMKDKGVSRFGIGYKAAIKIMEECE